MAASHHLEKFLAIISAVEKFYSEDFFPRPERGSPPDQYTAAGCRLACARIREATEKTFTRGTFVRNETGRELQDAWAAKFAEWWMMWPRGKRVNKAYARRAWVKHRPRRLEDVTGKAAMITQRFLAFQSREWASRPLDKWPYPASWLNGQEFDEPKVPGAESGPRKRFPEPVDPAKGGDMRDRLYEPPDSGGG